MKKRVRNASLAKRIAVMAYVMVFLCTTIVGIISYTLYRDDSIESNAKRSLSIAESVAAGIDPIQFQEILKTDTKTQYWHEAKAFVDKIGINTGVRYLYVLDKNYDTEVKYFVEGANRYETESLDLGYEDSIDSYAEEMFESIKTGMSKTTDVYSSEGYGMMVSGFAPILDSNNSVVGVVGIDLDMESVMQASNMFGLYILIGVLAFSIIFGLIARSYINRNVGKPIQELCLASQKIAQGDLNLELSIHSNDEIGKLTVLFQDMVNSTKRQVEILESLAGGDLTSLVTPRGDQDAMSFAMIKMIDNLNRMFEDIHNSTVHVTTTSNQMADSAQLLAQGSNEQTNTVEKLGYAISKIASKTKENSEMADKASCLSDTIKSNAEKGSGQMDRMLQSVKDIKEASESINTVIRVIDDIAFQINILSLNASVEAARAGEHGKGFAVVANEVRNLAAKSATAASETNALIVNAMDKAALGAGIADETAQSLAKIVSGISESSQIVREIAKSSTQQIEAIMEMNESIDRVTQVVQQNSAMAEQSAAASQEMSGQSTMLQGLVAEFKLKNDYMRDLPPMLENKN